MIFLINTSAVSGPVIGPSPVKKAVTPGPAKPVKRAVTPGPSPVKKVVTPSPVKRAVRH